jgi:energy-coupling factor transporter ATP-binding protein EcfA2
MCKYKGIFDREVIAMYLKTLTYHEHENTPTTWAVKKLNFGHVTLLVGKNSSGKSRVLSVIASLAGLLAGRVGGFGSGTWDANFARSKGEAVEKQTYHVSFSGGVVVSEFFRIKNSIVMRRDEKGEGFVLRKNTENKVQYKVDRNQLMAVVRSDAYQHPQFDHLKKWAKNVCLYRFGSEFGRGNLVGTIAPPPDPTAILEVSSLVENVTQVFANTKARFEAEYRDSVVEDMNSIGYEIDDILLVQVGGGFSVNGSAPMALGVKEKRVSCYVAQDHLSQGMYRALAIIIQFNANVLWTRSSMVGREPKLGDSPLVLIDDIGEGLDHERSRKLIELLMKKALKHNIQIVMSSNDRYVMNYVSLEYWSVLQREGAVVTAIDHTNAQDVFEEFSYSGLSNFDFFSGKHYASEGKQ